MISQKITSAKLQKKIQPSKAVYIFFDIVEKSVLLTDFPIPLYITMTYKTSLGKRFKEIRLHILINKRRYIKNYLAFMEHYQCR